MKNLIGIIVLAGVCVGLAVVLLTTKKQAAEEKRKDTETIVDLSNKVVKATDDLSEIRQGGRFAAHWQLRKEKTMGTRSRIAVRNADGTYTRIYCHWDGYPSHNGKILRDHYTDPDKIAALIALGDISSLSHNIGEKHDFDDYNTARANNWTTSTAVTVARPAPRPLPPPTWTR